MPRHPEHKGDKKQFASGEKGDASQRHWMRTTRSQYGHQTRPMPSSLQIHIWNERLSKTNQTVRKLGMTGFHRRVARLRIAHDAYFRIRTHPASFVSGGG